MYVGVHFPTDIISGAVIGTIIGFATGKLYNKYYGLA